MASHSEYMNILDVESPVRNGLFYLLALLFVGFIIIIITIF